ncbi:MAG: hypothetical protein NT169_25550 [Chloroflexi bacterium]|nr:hypothetical protein [Chloroflexota bacterium]
MGADDLERQVIAAVLERILTPEHVASIWRELQDRLGGAKLTEEIAELNDRITSAQRTLNRLLDVVEQGGLAAQATAARLAQRQAELTDLTAQRVAKEQRQAAFAKALAPEELTAVLVALRTGVTADEAPVARRALKAFIERVVVKGAELRIDYRAEVLLALGEVPPRGQWACASINIGGTANRRSL